MFSYPIYHFDRLGGIPFGKFFNQSTTQEVVAYGFIVWVPTCEV
jgi:hypothetical protein